MMIIQQCDDHKPIPYCNWSALSRPSRHVPAEGMLAHLASARQSIKRANFSFEVSVAGYKHSINSIACIDMLQFRHAETKRPRGRQSFLDRYPSLHIMAREIRVSFLGGAMIRKRNIGRAVAIGGLTAAVALLAGPPAASADELADLRANQELLQRRIDQLAQNPPGPGIGVPGAYGTQAVPGQPLAGGSFPRSFLIPGTDTSIRVGGFIDETFDYYFQGGPPNGNQSTTVGVTGNLESAPLNAAGKTVPGFPTAGNLVPQSTASSRGNGVFSQSPRETRLNVETRTPTAWGESRTFIEFDFAGVGNGSGFLGSNLTTVSDNLIPRLRYAYATLGGFLAGQANSNFSDPDANPETLDFGGPAGLAGVTRIPQVRYTYAGPWGSAWSVSAETPETDIVTPAGNVKSDTNVVSILNTPGANQPFNSTAGCVANGITLTATLVSTTNPGGNCLLSCTPTKASAPDLTFASYWSQPWGHVDFRGLIRPTLTVNDGRLVDRTFMGYGGGVSGDVKPGWFGWNRDDFQFQFSVGRGIGRDFNETN